MDNRPIGIFDSGVGGLTVVKEIFKALPNEQIVYLGDTARVPYGTKSQETIKRFSVENVEFLMRFKVKLIVVACNSASSVALPILRKRFKIPIVGVIRPGALKAIKVSRNGRIGVIGTSATIRSRAYEKEICRMSKSIRVVSQACPLFVPFAEEGWVNGRIISEIAEEYIAPLIKKRIDTLILGCTHYPLLRRVISKAVSGRITIVDSASSVAEEVNGILRERSMMGDAAMPPRHSFFATDAVGQFVKVGEKFLGTKIINARRAGYV